MGYTIRCVCTRHSPTKHAAVVVMMMMMMHRMSATTAADDAPRLPVPRDLLGTPCTTTRRAGPAAAAATATAVAGVF